MPLQKGTPQLRENSRVQALELRDRNRELSSQPGGSETANKGLLCWFHLTCACASLRLDRLLVDKFSEDALHDKSKIRSGPAEG